jgi:hypothetical protein
MRRYVGGGRPIRRRRRRLRRLSRGVPDHLISAKKIVHGAEEPADQGRNKARRRSEGNGGADLANH